MAESSWCLWGSNSNLPMLTRLAETLLQFCITIPIDASFLTLSLRNFQNLRCYWLRELNYWHKRSQRVLDNLQPKADQLGFELVPLAN